MTGSPGPTRLGELLDGVLEGAGVQEQLDRMSALDAWGEAVGEGIAEVTRPLRVDGAVLFVEVRSSAWLMELNMMRRRIRERLNEGRTGGSIDEIRFVLAGDG